LMEVHHYMRPMRILATRSSGPIMSGLPRNKTRI
jgi:hypothetical protein